jgi:hypothetical protein
MKKSQTKRLSDADARRLLNVVEGVGQVSNSNSVLQTELEMTTTTMTMKAAMALPQPTTTGLQTVFAGAIASVME